jgi:hypothetical protein
LKPGGAMQCIVGCSYGHYATSLGFGVRIQVLSAVPWLGKAAGDAADCIYNGVLHPSNICRHHTKLDVS